MRSPRPMRWCSWWSRASPSKRTWRGRLPDRCAPWYQGRYAQGGMAALGREEGWRRGRRRISGKRLRSIEMLKSQGMSNRAIAHRLGVSERAIRKQAGPSKPAESPQLALAGITTAAAGKLPASARSTSDEADRGTPSVDGDPIAASADDD